MLTFSRSFGTPAIVYLTLNPNVETLGYSRMSPPGQFLRTVLALRLQFAPLVPTRNLHPPRNTPLMESSSGISFVIRLRTLAQTKKVSVNLTDTFLSRKSTLASRVLTNQCSIFKRETSGA